MTIALNIIKYVLIVYNIIIILGLLLDIKDNKENGIFNWLLFFFCGITIAYLFIK